GSLRGRRLRVLVRGGLLLLFSRLLVLQLVRLDNLGELLLRGILTLLVLGPRRRCLGYPRRLDALRGSVLAPELNAGLDATDAHELELHAAVLVTCRIAIALVEGAVATEANGPHSTSFDATLHERRMNRLSALAREAHVERVGADLVGMTGDFDVFDLRVVQD